MVIPKNENRAAVLRVVLLEGLNIKKVSDQQPKLNCSLQLGKQKEDTSIQCDYKNPIWNNTFEFNVYDEEFSEELLVYLRNQGPKSLKDGFSNYEDIGSIKLDLSSIKPEITHNISKSLNENNGGRLRLLVTITGISSQDAPSHLANLSRWNALEIRLKDRKSPTAFASSEHGFVGRLLVRINKAEGLPASKYLSDRPDPYCSIRLRDDLFRTHTVSKTVTPAWNKCFEFDVRDVNDCLHIDVLDDGENKKTRSLGAIKIPLLLIKNHERSWYSLKDNTLRNSAKGEDPKLQLEFLFVFNISMLQCLVDK